MTTHTRSINQGRKLVLIKKFYVTYQNFDYSYIELLWQQRRNNVKTKDEALTNEIINRIDALRYECGYSITKLAELSDIPESTLKSILSRKTCPKILTIYKLCDAFGISVWQFFLYPNKIIAFTKTNLDLINKIERLSPEQKKIILSTIEAFANQKP